MNTGKDASRHRPGRVGRLRRSLRGRRLALLVFIVLLGPALFLVAGSPTRIATVRGSSMAPFLRSGDIVVIGKTDPYSVGDVVQYDDPGLGAVVHRIVGTTPQGNFILRGDNNSWADVKQPAPAEIRGRVLRVVPDGTKYVDSARNLASSPPGLALAMTPALLAMLRVPRRRTRTGDTGSRAGFGAAHAGEPAARPWALDLSRLRPSPEGSFERPRPTEAQERAVDDAPAANSSDWQLAVVSSGVLQLLATACITIAAVALVGLTATGLTGTTRNLSTTVPHTQRLALQYGGTADPEVYDGGTVEPGEPIYRALTDSVVFSFEYLLDGEQVADPAGRYRLVATIKGPDGWRWSLDVLPWTDFRGPRVGGSGTFDFSEVEAVTSRMEARTRVAADHYIVTVAPEVSVAGTLQGRPFAESARAPFDFALDANRFVYRPSATGEETALVRSFGGETTSESEVDRTFKLLGHNVRVSDARRWSLLALGVSLALLAAHALMLRAASRHDPAAAFRRRNARYLLKGRISDVLHMPTAIEVGQLEDLVKLADSHDGFIIDEGDGFYFPRGDTLYWARASSKPGTRVPSGAEGH